MENGNEKQIILTRWDVHLLTIHVIWISMEKLVSKKQIKYRMTNFDTNFAKWMLLPL